MDALFNAIGLTGMGMMLTAYFLQQSHSVGSRSGLYLWLNFAGALAMIVSLLRFWNLASFLLELAWAAISVYGLLRLYKKGGEDRDKYGHE